MLKLLATTTDPVEATLLMSRLREAGVPCVRGPGGVVGRGTLRSSRDILVEEHHLPRAREVLAEDRGGFDEAELARLSEQAGRAAAAHAASAPSPPRHAGGATGEAAHAGLAAPRAHGRIYRAIVRLATGRSPEADQRPDPFGR